MHLNDLQCSSTVVHNAVLQGTLGHNYVSFFTQHLLALHHFCDVFLCRQKNSNLIGSARIPLKVYPDHPVVIILKVIECQ